MAPAHGNFRGAQAVMTGQVKQFRVEAEALDGLLLENNPATFAVERFEAALGVDKRKPQDKANDFIENDPCEFTKRRLVHGDQTAVDSAGTDG